MTRTRPLVSSLFAALMMLAASQANAQIKFNSPTPKIAIVDLQGIMRESLAAKSARTQMDAIAAKERTVLAAEEKKLRAQDQELQQQRAILTPEVFTERQQKLQADVINLQRRSRNLGQTLDQGLRRTNDQIQLILFDELRKLLDELDINLIINRSQIVIAVEGFDITKPALERLNKRLPSIELKLEKNTNAGKAK
ncbi:MAG: Skp family chaperone for outer membrane protein [Alphaproteobacteria bacterium]|jgi:Skp family chaperone for outer membrane proteins